MKNRNKLIVILGPTAVGKTDLSLQLAERLHTEIISGDSMLIYRGLDIGTAKPSKEELLRIKHHMIDILSPWENYNVTDFIQRVAPLIEEINRRGKIPILAGGTGLYIKALLEGYVFNDMGEDPEYRKYLEDLAEEKGRDFVFAMLKKADPETAKNLHVNNFRRVIRALEVLHLGKESISRANHYQATGELLYDCTVIGLNREREELYQNINHRVDVMVEHGLIAEVEELLRAGADINWQSMKGIGYKEIIPYVKGDISLEQAVDELKKNTRHFAKRQLTWFKKMPYIHWFNLSEYEAKGKQDSLLSDVMKLID